MGFGINNLVICVLNSRSFFSGYKSNYRELPDFVIIHSGSHKKKKGFLQKKQHVFRTLHFRKINGSVIGPGLTFSGGYGGNCPSRGNAFVLAIKVETYLNIQVFCLYVRISNRLLNFSLGLGIPVF